MTDEKNKAWRLVLSDGSVTTIPVVQERDGTGAVQRTWAVATVTHGGQSIRISSSRSYADPADAEANAVQFLISALMVRGVVIREVVGPGGNTQIEAAAAERERCAGICKRMVVVGRAWTAEQAIAAEVLFAAADEITARSPTRASCNPLNAACDALCAEIKQVTGVCSADIEVWRETDPNRPDGLRWGARVRWRDEDEAVTRTGGISPDAAMARLLTAVRAGLCGEIMCGGEPQPPRNWTGGVCSVCGLCIVRHRTKRHMAGCHGKDEGHGRREG